MNCFNKESKSKKKEKNIFFVFCVGEGGRWQVIYFFTTNRNLHNFFFLGGGGGVKAWNGRGSVARG